MTIKQKADAYDTAKREANYWRAIAQAAEQMSAGRQGNPALLAAGAQAYENLKNSSPETFGTEYTDQKKEGLVLIEEIRNRLKWLEEKISDL